MSFKAYLDSIKAKTGKTAEDFQLLAIKKGLTNRADLMAWLKKDFDLGYGHGNLIAHLILHHGEAAPTKTDKLSGLFAGKKASWRKSYDVLAAKVAKFGEDVGVFPGGTYINLNRGEKKFAILQPSSADRFDIGIKLKGVKAAGRLEAAGSWNSMVTHRVRVSDPKEVDAEIIAWLKKAYAEVK
jgi:hypothetical protein